MRDELGQEMSEGAIIWQEYTRAADAYDDQLLRQWNQNLDTMLIVVRTLCLLLSCIQVIPDQNLKATLFSAVVTAFVIDKFHDLGPSAQDLTNNLLLNVVQALKNPQLNTSQPNVEPPKFVPSPNDVWVNGLWFTSLACSLGDAAIAMLIKQWLNAYSAGLPASHQLRSRMRQHRFNALIKWKTPQIIGFLPFALSVCVMLFLAGLSILLFSLNNTIAIATTSCIGIIFIFHMASLLLPGLCNSPWKTAVSPLIYQSLFPLRKTLNSSGLQHFMEGISNLWKQLSLHDIMAQILSILRNIWLMLGNTGLCLFTAMVSIILCPVRVGQRMWSLLPPFLRLVLYFLSWPFILPINLIIKFTSYVNIIYECYSLRYRLRGGVPLKRIEESHWYNSTHFLASEYGDEMQFISEPRSLHWLDGQAILWMVSTSTDRSLTQHCIQSLAGLSADFKHVDILERLLHPVQRSLISCLCTEQMQYDQIELYARGLWHIEVNLAMRTGGHQRGSQMADLVHSQVKMVEQGLRKHPLAFIACICACRLLNEITSLLQSICDGPSVNTGYTSLHTRMMVETLAQEMSRRKRTDISMWTTVRSENALDTEVVPLLVKLLSFKSTLPVTVQCPFMPSLPDELGISIGELLTVLQEYTDGWLLCQNDKGEQGMVPIRCLGKVPNHPLNTSIAVALAIFTQSVPNIEILKYSNESSRTQDFYCLLCASLSVILRFPEYFKSHDMIDMVYDKFAVASLGLLAEPARDDSHYCSAITEIFKFTFSTQRSLNHDLVVALSKMDPQAYLHLQPGTIPDPTRHFVQSTPIEVQIALRICLGNLNARTQHLAGTSTLFDQDSELIKYVLSSNISMDARSQAFKLLLKKAHQSQVDKNQNQWKKLKLQGFLDAVQVFFTSIGSIDRSELDEWMDTLQMLCHSERTALRQSGAMRAFIIWAYQDWRGRPMMGDNLRDLNKMAKLLSLSVEDINDTSWFSSLQISQSYKARI